MPAIGFTGTRKGMTEIQTQTLLDILNLLNFTEVHHGDCIGADSEFNKLVALHFPEVIRIGHPPTNTKARAFSECTILREPKEYAERNHDIVNESLFLLAAPEGPEVTRSGTWMTIRYAHKIGKGFSIIKPDGMCTYKFYNFSKELGASNGRNND